MRKYFLTGAIIGAAALILSACTQPELPQDHYYRLEITPPNIGKLKLDGVLEVERFRADGLISGRPIAYSEGQGHLSEYHYHFWVEPPVDLLQDAMVTFLRKASLATHIVTPELRMNEDYLLTGKIKRLERDLSAEPKVVVELEIGLKQVRDDKILVLKTYKRELAQTGEGVHGSVETINRALSDIYTQFLNDVR
ncbi:MAG: ABC-type transport auxiliary lipoprotein family protein [Terasakiella sp.]|uniref:ABC-type transport auxiliary lipoprotein family protein n=1 Tax=unclassified Terasakiella TaxID=2614952 RepID=UPI003B0031B5